MSNFQETKEAYLMVPEEDTSKRGEFLKKLADLYETSEEAKDFWELLGQFSKYMAKSKGC